MKNASTIVAVLLVLLPGISSGQTLRDLLVENHFSYIPSAQGQFPTIIAIPGCSGISSDSAAAEMSNPQLREDDLLFRRHYRFMAEKLRASGFAVLLVNIHAAEGLLTACADPIDSERIAEYIDEAIAWAIELPFVDPDRLHIIGWSMGGGGVLQWLDGPRNDALHVRSAIAVYPPCNKHKNLSIHMPVLVLLGGSDDIADPAACEELVASATIERQVTVRNYAGARHGFDIEDAPPILDIGNGMTVGYQKEAAEASWEAILEFLAVPE